MKWRLAIAVSVALVSLSVLSAEPISNAPTSSAAVALDEDAVLRGQSVEIAMVSGATKVALSADRITLANADQTILEGSARALFNGRELNGDVILLTRVKDEKSDVKIVITAIVK